MTVVQPPSATVTFFFTDLEGVALTDDALHRVTADGIVRFGPPSGMTR